MLPVSAHKRFGPWLLALITLSFTVAHVQEAAEPELKPFIFKIRASDCLVGEDRALTGFLLPSQQGIVTALHGVVGCDNIRAQNNASAAGGDGARDTFRRLQITQVDVTHDVALLSSEELTGFISLKPERGLTTSTAEPESIYVLGYPLDVSGLLATTQIRIRNSTALINLIPPAEFTAFRECGSPAEDIFVYSLEGTLRPGESGAPILNQSHQVVGVAMGGVDAGRTEIVWASRWQDLDFLPKDAVQAELARRAEQNCLTDRFAQGQLGEAEQVAELTRAINNLRERIDIQDRQIEGLVVQLTSEDSTIEELRVRLGQLQESEDPREQQVVTLVADDNVDEAVSLLEGVVEGQLALREHEPAQPEQKDKELSQQLVNLALLQEFTDPQKALDNLRKATELDAGNLSALNQLGQLQLRLGFPQEAIASFESVQALSLELNYRQMESASLGNLGVVYGNLGRYEEALNYHEQSLAIIRKVGDRQGEADGLGNLGVVYGNLGRYEEALNSLEQALPIFREIGDRQGEGINRINLGNVYSRLSRYEEALDQLEQALAISREIGNREGEANGLGNLGVVYGNLGRYEEALNSLEQALAITREIGDRQGEANNLGGLGDIYSILGRYEEALYYYEQALAISREIGYHEREGQSLLGLGILYFQLAELETAIIAFQDAKKAFAAIASPYEQRVDELLRQLGVE